MEEHTAGSVREFVRRAVDITARWSPTGPSPTLWYRGVKSVAYDLVPGAYFRKECDEQTLALYFRQLSPGLLHHEPLDDWEWYYLMQHYGLPTRLLDWTESALTALYFAVDEDGSSDGAVWVLHPVALNKLAGEPYMIVPRIGNELDYWLPRQCGRHVRAHRFGQRERFGSNRKALAIYPKRHNPRIVVQRGVFTVHGKDETPINHLKLKLGGQDRLAKLIIRANRRKTIRKELHMLGFDTTAIYPEAQSVAEDLKRALDIK